MGIIYLINPKNYEPKYIYDSADLKKRLEKNLLRPGNERIIPKANIKNIKFGRFKGNENSLKTRYENIFGKIDIRVVVKIFNWDLTKSFEKIIKNECFGNHKKLINTLEWLDDDRIDMDIAEKLIIDKYQEFKQKM